MMVNTFFIGEELGGKLCICCPTEENDKFIWMETQENSRKFFLNFSVWNLKTDGHENGRGIILGHF